MRCFLRSGRGRRRRHECPHEQTRLVWGTLIFKRGALPGPPAFGHMMVLVPSPCGITLEGENTCTGDAGGGFMVFPIFLSFDFGGGGGGGGDSDNSCHPRTARFPIGGIDLCQELPGKPTLVQSWVCDDGTMECCRGKVGEFTSPCEKRGKEYVATYREFSTFILAACCRK